MATMHAYLRQGHGDMDPAETVIYGPSTSNQVKCAGKQPGFCNEKAWELLGGSRSMDMLPRTILKWHFGERFLKS